jgi:hypothetical protein
VRAWCVCAGSDAKNSVFGALAPSGGRHKQFNCGFASNSPSALRLAGPCARWVWCCVLLFGSLAAVMCIYAIWRIIRRRMARMADARGARIADGGRWSLVAGRGRAAMGHGAWSPEANAGVAHRLRSSAPCRCPGPGPALAAGSSSSPGERVTLFNSTGPGPRSDSARRARARPPPAASWSGGCLWHGLYPRNPVTAFVMKNPLTTRWTHKMPARRSGLIPAAFTLDTLVLTPRAT